jgi:hypothetical protein
MNRFIQFGAITSLSLDQWSFGLVGGDMVSPLIL